jgi:ABC-2 type transport system permease protein
VPPGYFGNGLALLSRGQVATAAVRGLLLAAFAALGYLVAYRQLLTFHLNAPRAGTSLSRRGQRNLFAHTGSLGHTLFVREALDLWRNPRARLLASVPFLLAILFRLLSGRDLIVFLAGNTASAWLIGSLCLYGAVVLGSTFSQNAFGYDGLGLAALLAAPFDPRALLLAKNRLHGLAAAGLALAVSLFVLVYFRHVRFVDWACAMAAVAGLIPVLLAAGNFLSVIFPVKFHADLKRRDRLPFAASMLGVGAAGLGVLPFTLALRAAGKDGVTWESFLFIALSAALFWFGYRALLPVALRLLDERRELVLRAVARG